MINNTQLSLITWPNMVTIIIASSDTKPFLCPVLTEAVSSVRLELHAGRRDVLHATQKSFDDDILHTHHQAWTCMKKVLTRQDGSNTIGAILSGY